MSRVREGLIRKLVRELIRQELDEANSTSSVGGSYNTPHAFGGSNKKGKGKGKAGYTGGHDEPTDGTGHFIAKDPKLRKTESVNEGKLNEFMYAKLGSKVEKFVKQYYGKNKFVSLPAWKVTMTYPDQPGRTHDQWVKAKSAKDAIQISKKMWSNQNIKVGKAIFDDEHWLGVQKAQKTGFTEGEIKIKKESVNEAVKEIQLKEKIFEPAKWWKSDPEELLRHVYWLKGQMAPSDKKKRAQAYKDIATQLNKKYRAPKKDFQRHFSYDESVNESSYHKRQITDFIKKNKDSEYTPTIQVKGSKSKTNYLNISFEALEQLAKIMMKESVNEGISVADERRVGKFTIVILTNGGKMRSAILSKNNDNKYNRNDKDVLKNLWDLAGKYKGQEIKESINEGRYHAWRNDDTMTPKQKIGIAMRETRDSLKELERVVRYNVKLKNELKVDSRDYWKNTHKALNKISERLVKLANKVGQLH